MSNLATRNARVLVAEDEPLISRLFSVILQRAGYEVDVAESGNEAVTKWEEGAYDLILMDLELPGMTGFEAAAAVRKKEATLGTFTPIIAVTAWTLDDEERRCEAAGIDHYLRKPLNIKNTLQLIEETLAENSQVQAECCS